MEKVEQEKVYEPPVLVEVGGFTELTCGNWTGHGTDWGGSSGAPYYYSW